MTFDFRASQLRTSKIIASGSTGTNAKLLLYPIAADLAPLNRGNINPAVFGTGSIGQDVFLYVSGVVGGRDGTDHGIAVFGGDVYHSGNIIMEGLLNANNIVNFNAGFNVSGFPGIGITCPLTMSFYAPHFTAGLSGSLQRLNDGSPYLIAGPNITITTQSNGAIAISGSGVGAALNVANTWTAAQTFASGVGATIITASGGGFTLDIPWGSAGIASIGNSSGNGAHLLVAGDLILRPVGGNDGRFTQTNSSARTWTMPDVSGYVALTNRVLAGPNITVNTYAGGYVAITGSGGGGGGTQHEFIAGYNATNLTDPGQVCGRISFEPSEMPSSSIILRTVLSTTTGSNTVFVKLYNHTSGAYVCLGGGVVTSLSSSATTLPAKVQSVNLTSATNWSSGSAIYELQLFTADSSFLGMLGSAQFICS